MIEQEGVTKFDLRFTPAGPLAMESLRALNAWRTMFYRLGLIGQDPARYGGVGFGNVSRRMEPLGAASEPQFAVTGTRIGHLPALDARHYALVTACDPEHNRVVAQGPVAPSSESLTHGMLYRVDDGIRYVFHVHSSDVWRHARVLNIPITHSNVHYGTPEMTAEVRRLFADARGRQQGVFAMGGHEDGVVSYGRTAADTGATLLRALARALEH